MGEKDITLAVFTFILQRKLFCIVKNCDCYISPQKVGHTCAQGRAAAAELTGLRSASVQVPPSPLPTSYLRWGYKFADEKIFCKIF